MILAAFGLLYVTESSVLGAERVLHVFRHFIIIIVIELTHSKTIMENTVEIEPQPAALDFKSLSQYSSRSK